MTSESRHVRRFDNLVLHGRRDHYAVCANAVPTVHFSEQHSSDRCVEFRPCPFCNRLFVFAIATQLPGRLAEIVFGLFFGPLGCVDAVDDSSGGLLPDCRFLARHRADGADMGCPAQGIRELIHFAREILNDKVVFSHELLKPKKSSFVHRAQPLERFVVTHQGERHPVQVVMECLNRLRCSRHFQKKRAVILLMPFESLREIRNDSHRSFLLVQKNSPEAMLQ